MSGRGSIMATPSTGVQGVRTVSSEADCVVRCGRGSEAKDGAARTLIPVAQAAAGRRTMGPSQQRTRPAGMPKEVGPEKSLLSTKQRADTGVQVPSGVLAPNDAEVAGKGTPISCLLCGREAKCSMADLSEADKEQIAVVLKQVLELSELNETTSSQLEAERAAREAEKVAREELVSREAALRSEAHNLREKLGHALDLLRAYQKRVTDMQQALISSDQAMASLQHEHRMLLARSLGARMPPPTPPSVKATATQASGAGDLSAAVEGIAAALAQGRQDSLKTPRELSSHPAPVEPGTHENTPAPQRPAPIPHALDESSSSLQAASTMVSTSRVEQDARPVEELELSEQMEATIPRAQHQNEQAKADGTASTAPPSSSCYAHVHDGGLRSGSFGGCQTQTQQTSTSHSGISPPHAGTEGVVSSVAARVETKCDASTHESGPGSPVHFIASGWQTSAGNNEATTLANAGAATRVLKSGADCDAFKSGPGSSSQQPPPVPCEVHSEDSLSGPPGGIPCRRSLPFEDLADAPLTHIRSVHMDASKHETTAPSRLSTRRPPHMDASKHETTAPSGPALTRVDISSSSASSSSEDDEEPLMRHGTRDSLGAPCQLAPSQMSAKSIRLTHAHLSDAAGSALKQTGGRRPLVLANSKCGPADDEQDVSREHRASREGLGAANAVSPPQQARSKAEKSGKTPTRGAREKAARRRWKHGELQTRMRSYKEEGRCEADVAEDKGGAEAGRVLTAMPNDTIDALLLPQQQQELNGVEEFYDKSFFDLVDLLDEDREDPSSSPVLDNNAHSTRHVRSADLTRSPPRSQAVRLQDIPDALLDHIDDDLAAESGSEQIALPEEYRSLVEGAADACSAGSGGGKIASHSAIKPYLRHHGPRQPLATLGNARYK